jgi:hypothetical protein
MFEEIRALDWRWQLLALAAVVGTSVGLACDGGGDGEGTVLVTVSTPTATAVPTPDPTPTPVPTPTPTPGPDVCGVNPDPAPLSLLQVQEPKPRDRVRVPLHVRGWGSTIGFEDFGVVVALVDAEREVVQDWVVPPQQQRALRILPPGLENTEFTRPFAIDILVADLAGPTPFCLWVFVETDGEGNPKGVVQVPILVVP